LPFDAIVLAGTSPGGALQEYAKVKNRALIPIGEQMMVQYVVNALKGVSSINKIAIVGAVQELLPYYENDPEVVLAEQGETHIATLLNGLKVLGSGPDRQIVVATSDIPLLSTAAVEDFLNQCAQKDGDLFYPIVPKEINEQRFPGVKRTYVHLRDGVFTGGNLFLVRVSIIEPCAAKAETLVSLRKSPLALCRLIGPMFIMKYLLHRLSLREVELKFSRLLGIEGYGIISNYPEIGIDVDKPSDLEFVRQILVGTSPI
jgi:molybdopterin-guanine dinucleotide biosynthesis protein A